MSAAGERATEIEELSQLLRFDYEQTLGVIDGVVRVSANVRSIATTVWVGLLAAAIQTDEGRLAAIAAGSVVIFALLDAYHGWLYAVASKRGHEMEKRLQRYYKHLQRKDDETDEKEVLKELRKHQFGQLSQFPDTPWDFYRKAKPPSIYRRFYPALLAFAACAAVTIGGSEDEHPTCDERCRGQVTREATQTDNADSVPEQRSSKAPRNDG